MNFCNVRYNNDRIIITHIHPHQTYTNELDQNIISIIFDIILSIKSIIELVSIKTEFDLIFIYLCIITSSIIAQKGEWKSFDENEMKNDNNGQQQSHRHHSHPSSTNTRSTFISMLFFALSLSLALNNL